MLGHADLKMTMKYADLLPDAIQWPGSRYHEMLDTNTGATLEVTSDGNV